jgi:hypothetical protein
MSPTQQNAGCWPGGCWILDRREFVVGRGGLEPPTSAVTGPKRCTNESGGPSVRRGVMWREMDRCSTGREVRIGR